MPKKVTIEDFVKRAKLKHKSFYSYEKSVYINSETPIIITCPKHGDFYQSTANHLSGKGCRGCGIEKNSLQRQIPEPGNSFKDKFPTKCKEWSIKNNLGPENYNWGSTVKVWRCCRNCKHEWQTSIAKWSNDRGCPQCCIPSKIVSDKNNLAILFPELKTEWSDNNKKNIEDYSYSSHTKCYWNCSKCNTEYEARISSRTHGKTGCPKCNISHGEKLIIEYLTKNNIHYIKEYKIENCKFKSYLRFDFAIFDKNNQLKILLEFHGKQHYEPHPLWHNNSFYNKEFLMCQKRDKIKIDYCKDSNIELIIIHYKDKLKINEILNETFKNANIFI